jgi:hypothetical protein
MFQGAMSRKATEGAGKAATPEESPDVARRRCDSTPIRFVRVLKVAARVAGRRAYGKNCRNAPVAWLAVYPSR